jgi:hypothetical protein
MRIVDSRDWLREQRDVALAEIDRRAARASTDEERGALDAERRAVRKQYRAELRRARRIPW